MKLNTFLLEKVAIVAGHASLGIIDNVTFNIGSTVKNAFTEVAEYSNQCNKAMHYLRIETFLRSTSLSETEVNNFLSANSDNYLLGLEVLKTLDQILTDKQAEMSGRNFTLMVKEIITKETYYKVQHIILRLNEYLISELTKDVPDFEDLNSRYTLEYEFYEPSFIFNMQPNAEEEKIYNFEKNIRDFLSQQIKSKAIQDLLAFDFISQVPTELMAGQTHEKLPEYKKTPFLLWFYFNIF